MKALAFLIPALLAARAEADEIAPKARTLAERGRLMHASGNYAAAVDAFKEAYVISPSAGLLFNLAQSYRLMGDCENASIMYHRYLASDPPDEGKAIAEANLGLVERCVSDHIPLPPPPAPKPEAVTAAQQVTATPTDDEPTSGRLQKNVGIGFAAAGIVALGGSLFFELRAASAASDVSNAYANGGAAKDIAATDQRGRDSARDAQLLLAGGSLALVGGVALYYLGYRAEHARPALAVVPASGGGHVSMSWTW